MRNGDGETAFDVEDKEEEMFIVVIVVAIVAECCSTAAVGNKTGQESPN
jgi:hypothetical protein